MPYLGHEPMPTAMAIAASHVIDTNIYDDGDKKRYAGIKIVFISRCEFTVVKAAKARAH